MLWTSSALKTEQTSSDTHAFKCQKASLCHPKCLLLERRICGIWVSTTWNQHNKQHRFGPQPLLLWFLEPGQESVMKPQLTHFFRGRWPSMQSLAKMFIFLKMPSFTLFTMDLIRDTSWLQNALRIMFSSPAFQVRYSLYSATGDSVWKHLSSRDIGWEEDQEEKVNNPEKWDGYEREVERGWEVGKRQSPWEHSYWVILLLTFFQLCQPCPRLGRPILLIAPSFQSWLSFRCSSMEESLLVLPLVVPGPMARDGSGRTETLATGFHSPTSPPSPAVCLAAPVFTALLLAPFGGWGSFLGTLCIQTLPY